MRSTQLFLCLLVFAFSCSLSAWANSCDPFANYKCSGSTPNDVDVNGKGASGQRVGDLLGNNFGIAFDGKRSLKGDDLIILAAAPNGLKGTLNGKSFTSLSTFPETGAPAAIRSTWTGLGIDFKSPQFGYVNLGAITGSSIPITEMGIGSGTIFYAEIINPKNDRILFITPNQDAGILGSTAVTPEPASLTLTGIGLVGLAFFMRRRASKS